MKIAPIEISEVGPGIDLSNLATGLAIKMADPVRDLTSARNAVTLVYDLADYLNPRLTFSAKEYGDEPHAPPAGPFGDDAAFDGVAIGTDGQSWYEVRDLRHLRSDRFTDVELDLAAAAAAHGLTCGDGFRVRFCQVDDNPAPMDGIFLHRIELTANLKDPIFHLPMDDNAASPTVRDTAPGGNDQTLLDPTGDPNTAAHSVPGPNAATALSFDGVDDVIAFGPTLLADLVAADRDFTLAFWYRTAADPGAVAKVFFRRAGAEDRPYVKCFVKADRFYWWVHWGDNYVYLYSPVGMLNGQWRHVAARRQGQTLALWIDGAAADTRTDRDYARSFADPDWDPRALGQTYAAATSDWPFDMADLRVYDHAITDEEIAAIANPAG